MMFLLAKLAKEITSVYAIFFVPFISDNSLY